MSSTTENLRDEKQVFLLYTLFAGDATKTAHALGCSVLSVARLAEKGNWDKKVGEIAALRNSDRPGDLERAINRAINYTDAHRYRLQLQRVLDQIQALPDDELESLMILTTVDKAGNVHRHLSTRALADLSSAMEKAHALTYLALGDTAQDRARRKEEKEDGVLAASILNQQIIEAMAQAGSLEAPREQLEAAQKKRAEEILMSEASLESPTSTEDETTTIDEIMEVIPPLKEGK